MKKKLPAYELSQLENLKNDPFGFLIMNYYTPKNLAKQREYAEISTTQPNELTRGFYKCSSTAQKLFIVIVAEFIKKNKKNKKNKSRIVSLELANIIHGLNITDGSKTRELFKKSANEVLELNVIMRDNENTYYKINLFESTKIDWNWGILKFELTEKFTNFLEQEHKKGFTIFNLAVTGKLHFYASRYYQIAMSYYGFKGECINISEWAKKNGVTKKNSWFFAYSINELRALFKIEDNQYTDVRNLKKKVVLTPIEELNSKIPYLKIQVETILCKRKISGFIFWVTELPEIQKKHKKNETQEERDEINIINQELNELESFKNKYPIEFKDALEKVKIKNKDKHFTININNEFEAINILKDSGLTI